jgi:hypothetical protein
MALEHVPTPIELFRRRRELRGALVTVDAAIALRNERGPRGAETVDFDGLREDLLVALWLTEAQLARR